MRTYPHAFLAAALLLLTVQGTVAAERNEWRHPGLSPFSSTPLEDVDENGRREELRLLGLPEHLIKKAVTATAVPGEMYQLADDDCFDNQLFRVKGVAKMAHNVCVAFDGNQDRQAERWVILDDDGTVYEITDPRVCKNRSLKKKEAPPPRAPAPPPPPPAPCFRINFEYPRNRNSQAPVNYETAANLESRGFWYGSEAQAMLHPDTLYAFVLVHIDVTEEERAELISDHCFGYGDETGFHSETSYCVGTCVSGEYPSPRILAALRRQKGITLPAREPSGTFRFGLANGRGYLSLPLTYAARFGLYCVETQGRYAVSLTGFRLRRATFYFDAVTPEEIQPSLMRPQGASDLELLSQDSTTRYLSGDGSF